MPFCSKLGNEASGAPQQKMCWARGAQHQASSESGYSIALGKKKKKRDSPVLLQIELQLQLGPLWLRTCVLGFFLHVHVLIGSCSRRGVHQEQQLRGDAVRDVDVPDVKVQLDLQIDGQGCEEGIRGMEERILRIS